MQIFIPHKLIGSNFDPLHITYSRSGTYAGLQMGGRWERVSVRSRAHVADPSPTDNVQVR